MNPARRDRKRAFKPVIEQAEPPSRAAGPPPPRSPARTGSKRPARFWPGLAPWVIACSAAVLLLWNLTDTYLWQDEANTAVLAVRLLEHGRDRKSVV